jgi:hypothetical protein
MNYSLQIHYCGLLQQTEIPKKQISEKFNFLIIHVFSTFGWATETVICYRRSAFVICCQPTPHNSTRLNYTASKPEISLVCVSVTG